MSLCFRAYVTSVSEVQLTVELGDTSRSSRHQHSVNGISTKISYNKDSVMSLDETQKDVSSNT